MVGENNNQRPGPLDWLAIAIATLVMAVPLVLFGAVHPTVQWGISLLVVIAFVVIQVRDRRAGQPLNWHPLPLLFACLAGLALLQTLPIPLSWLDVISPRSAGAAREVARCLGQPLTVAPITMDRTGTLMAAARWWLLAVASLTLLQAFRSRRVRRLVPWILLAVTSFAVLVGIAQTAISATRIYGLFEPWQSNAQAGPGGPFVSGNHLGHLCLLAAMVSLALLHTRYERRTVGLLVGSFVLSVAGIMLGQARGALLALGICGLVWALLPDRGPSRRLRRGMLVALLTLDVLALVALRSQTLRAFFQWESLSRQFELSKLGHLARGFAVLRSFPWLGTGADALSATNLAVMDGQRAVHMSYLENDYFQILVDFGLVGTALVLIIAGMTWRRHARRVKKLHRTGRLAWWLAVVAYALVSLVSFSVQVPALMLAVTAIYLARLAEPSPIPLKPRAGWVAVAAVTGVSLWFLAVHPSIAGKAQPEGRLELVNELLLKPLDGRALWVTAVTHANLLAGDELERLANLASELAGNDAYLMIGLAEFRRERGQLVDSFGLLEGAWARGFTVASLLDPFLERVQKVEDLLAIFRAYPHRSEVIMNALARASRHADLMQTALALPDSPMVIYHRTWAAVGLGEHELARGMAERLEFRQDMSADDCTWTASARHLSGNREEAIGIMARCLEIQPTQPTHIIRYLQWALETQEMARTHGTSIDHWLARLNLLAPANPAFMRVYEQLRASAHALAGRCRAAALMLSEAGTGEGLFPYVPPWVWQACPDLDR